MNRTERKASRNSDALYGVYSINRVVKRAYERGFKEGAEYLGERASVLCRERAKSHDCVFLLTTEIRAKREEARELAEIVAKLPFEEEQEGNEP